MPKPKLLPGSFLFLCALLLQLASSAPHVRAEPPKAEVDPAARSAFEAGADAYDHGRFGEALREFERAYQLSPHPKLLFNIGRAADGDGQSERAISAYQSYLLAFPRADNREFVESRIAKLKAAPSASAPGAGAPTTAPFVALAPASVAAADVASSERGAPAAPLPAAPSDQPPVWKRAWFWAAVGVVAAAVVTTAVIVAVKHNNADDSGPAVNEHVMTLEKR